MVYGTKSQLFFLISLIASKECFHVFRMMFRVALLTVLISVTSCSVSWNDLRRLLDEVQLDKRDIAWIDNNDNSQSSLPCEEGKGR